MRPRRSSHPIRQPPCVSPPSSSPRPPRRPPFPPPRPPPPALLMYVGIFRISGQSRNICDTCLCWGVSSSKVQALQMVGAMVSWLELEIPDWMLAGPESILSHSQALNCVGSCRPYLVADPSLKARYAIRVKCSIISFFSLHFLCSRSPLGDSTRLYSAYRWLLYCETSIADQNDYAW